MKDIKKHPELIEEMTSNIVEGYSVADAFSLMYASNSKSYPQFQNITSNQFTDIFKRAEFKASKIISSKAMSGKLEREPKHLPKGFYGSNQKRKSHGLFSNPYAYRISFKERIASKWKEVNYKTNNPTRTLGILMNHFGLNGLGANDRKIKTFLEVIENMK